MGMEDLQFSLMSQSDFIGQSNLDIEEIVLATLVNFPESYFKVAQQLSVKEFSSTETRYIYLVIKELSEVSKIDLATVTDKLIQKKYTDIMRQQKKGFDLVVFLNSICERIDSDAHLLHHVSILNGYAKRRELLTLSKDINEDCNSMVSPDEVVNKISTRIVDIQEMGDVVEFNINDANKEVLKSLEPKKDNKDIVKSHVGKVDNFIYSFEKGELIIIGAAPSMGKTSFALEIFKNNILNDVPGAFFSLEMMNVQLLQRMYAVEGNIPLSKLRTRLLSREEISSLNIAMGTFEDKSFWLDDKSRKLTQICNKIRKYVIRHHVKFVVIDYLQLITCDVGNKGNREQEVSTISRYLKELASELGIPIFALSQINRAIHARANKRPTLGDLRESGAIEQDADMVIFIHRPAYFQVENGIPDTEFVEIIFAKGRSTGVGMVEIAFRSKLAKYVDLSEEELKDMKDYHFSNIEPNSDFDE